MKKGERHFFSYVLQSRVFFVILVCAVIISAVRLSNEIARRVAITKQINALHAQVDQLRSERDSLSSLINSLSTDAYIEDAARKKLNLAKPGEQLVVIPGPTGTENKNMATSVASIPTPQVWWDYFFGQYAQ